MHIVQTSAARFDANIFPRCKSIKSGLLVNKFYRHKVVRLCAFLHDCIATSILHTLLIEAGLIDLIVLGQRAVGVQETVVSRDKDSGSAELVADNADDIFYFGWLHLFGRGKCTRHPCP